MFEDRSSVLSSQQQLDLARQVLRAESEAIKALAERLGEDFLRAVALCRECRGHLVVSGMGKAGLVGQKIAATLSSTGTRSHFLHPAEAFHGDLGTIHPDDVILLLSFSGRTEEIVRLIAPLHSMGNPLIAVTGQPQSPLGRAASVVLDLGPIEEACPLGLAPSSSTTAMLALGDALALVTSRLRRFEPEDFARFHPGGNLGRQLAPVEELMRPLTRCRVASEQQTVRQVLVAASQPGRRTGAIMLVDSDGHLSGLFTDSDLARLFESPVDPALDLPIAEVMTRSPLRVLKGTRLREAVHLLARRHISELPVVDDSGRPIGLLDITDVLDSAVTTNATSSHAGLQEPSSTTVPFPSLRRESA